MEWRKNSKISDNQEKECRSSSKEKKRVNEKKPFKTALLSTFMNIKKYVCRLFGGFFFFTAATQVLTFNYFLWFTRGNPCTKGNAVKTFVRQGKITVGKLSRDF